MDVRLDDGTVVTNVPDGITKRELLARLNKQPQSKPIPEQKISWLEGKLAKAPDWMSSDIPYRMAQGAADMPIGVTQLLANVASETRQMVSPRDQNLSNLVTGKNGSWAESMNDFVQKREKTMPEGFDGWRMAGSFMGPGMLFGAGAPATLGGRVAGGAKIGAISGLTNPVTDAENYGATVTANTLGGGLLGALMPFGWEGLKAVGGVGRNILDSIRGQNGINALAGRMAAKAAGDKLDDVATKLEMGMDSPVPGLSWHAGQKAVPSGSAEFAALIDIARKRAGSSTHASDAAQDEAIRSLMQAVSKSADPLARQKAMDQLNALTGPIREAALNNANIAGQKGAELSQKTRDRLASKENIGAISGDFIQGARTQQNLADTFTPVSGMPRVSGRVSPNQEIADQSRAALNDAQQIYRQRLEEAGFRQRQLDSLAKHGNFPLRGDELFGQIQARLTAPGDRASDAIVQGLTPIRDKIARLTDKNGVINASDIYTIRKELNQDLQALAKSNNWDAGRLSSIEISVKKYIDDAIKKAGAGDLWETYLKTHSQGMRDVNDITIGRELEKALFSGSGKLTREKFQNAMSQATQSPDVLRLVGAARLGNIEKSMSPPGFGKVNAIEQSLQRDFDFDALAKAGMPKAIDIAGIPHLPQTGILDPKIGIARSVLNRFIGKEHGRVLDTIAKATPEQLAEMMRKATPKEKSALLDHFFRAQAVAAGQVPD